MSINDNQKIYSNKHILFFDNIIKKKRVEMTDVIKIFLKDKNIEDILDIGSTEDENNPSSNYIVKNLGNYKIYKSISDQLIKSNFFTYKLNKSITSDFSEQEIKQYKSDLVISNATIEHVGSIENQIKMCENIIKLSNKYFIINTPNKFHPIEFHTKIPLIHWLPNKFYRIILKFLGLKFFADENNLNLLSENDLVLIMKKLNQVNFSIKKIKFLFFCSNLILIGKKY
jgi:hypothetical protein